MPTVLNCAACVVIAAVLLPRIASQAPSTAPAAANRPSAKQTTSSAKVDGKPIDVFTLTNGRGIEMQVMSYGAIIMALKVPDRQGRAADVVLGFDSPEGYLAEPPPPYFGALIGRYGNRIGKAQF
jgi:aldose 1-epimerase